MAARGARAAGVMPVIGLLGATRGPDHCKFNGFYHRSAASAWIRKHLKITSGRYDAVFEPAPANRVSVGHKPVGDSHCGEKRTLRDSISLPQLVFLPRAEIAGSAAIFWPR